jgi:hypothetical protein
MEVKVVSRRLSKLIRELPDPISGPLVRRSFALDRSMADGFVFKIAKTREELEAAYRLVHDVYVEEGYSDRQETGTRINLRYALPTTTTFIGTHRGRVVITMTLIGDSPLGLPMDMIFSEELFALRRQGRYFTEVGAFASHPDFRRKQQVLAMYLNKIMYTYALHYLGSDDLVIAVNPKHEWVYRTLMLFEKIAGTKPYRYVKGAPAVAMRLNLRTCRAHWKRVFNGSPPQRNIDQFFNVERPAAIELPAAGGPFNVWDEAMFSHFFEKKTDPRRENYGSLADLYRTLGLGAGEPGEHPVSRAGVRRRPSRNAETTGVERSRYAVKVTG